MERENKFRSRQTTLEAKITKSETWLQNNQDSPFYHEIDEETAKLVFQLSETIKLAEMYDKLKQDDPKLYIGTEVKLETIMGSKVFVIEDITPEGKIHLKTEYGHVVWTGDLVSKMVMEKVVG